MSPRKSNLPEQLASWSSRGPVAKLRSALRTAEDLTLAPGQPVVYSGEQYVIVSRIGGNQVMLRGIDGRHIVADEHDVEPAAREFKGAEAEGR